MNNNVFINCPFDDDYTEILHAITFAICYAGYAPRSALETKESGKERLSKIIGIIHECRLGIHDISRVEKAPGATLDLPRFNMPFEFGLFYGALHFGDEQQKAKVLLVLDSEQFRYQKTLSDIAGKDPAVHRNIPSDAISHVRDFLADKNGSGTLPGAENFIKVFRDFNTALPRIAKKLKISPTEIRRRNYWRDYVTCVNLWAEHGAKKNSQRSRKH